MKSTLVTHGCAYTKTTGGEYIESTQAFKRSIYAEMNKGKRQVSVNTGIQFTHEHLIDEMATGFLRADSHANTAVYTFSQKVNMPPIGGGVTFPVITPRVVFYREKSAVWAGVYKNNVGIFPFSNAFSDSTNVNVNGNSIRVWRLCLGSELESQFHRAATSTLPRAFEAIFTSLPNTDLQLLTQLSSVKFGDMITLALRTKQITKTDIARILTKFNENVRKVRTSDYTYNTMLCMASAVTTEAPGLINWFWSTAFGPNSEEDRLSRNLQNVLQRKMGE